MRLEGARCGILIILPHRAPRPVKVRFAQRHSGADLDRRKSILYLVTNLVICNINKILTILSQN